MYLIGKVEGLKVDKFRKFCEETKRDRDIFDIPTIDIFETFGTIKKEIQIRC